MKRDKVIYWFATGLISAGMLMSAFMYLTKNPQLMKSFQSTGYPDFFATILGIAKLLGSIVLLIPMWSKLKEWAYAGFVFTFIGAVWTHLATGTPWIAPFIALSILSVSYWFRLRAKVA
jgi:hypothetical protein